MEKKGFGRILSFKMPSGKGLNNKKLIFAGLFVITYVLLTMITSWKYFPTRSYSSGVVAPRDIEASHAFSVEDDEKTREAQFKAMNEVEPVYKRKDSIHRLVRDNLTKEFDFFDGLKEADDKKDALTAKELKSQLPIPLSDNALHIFVHADSVQREQMKIAVENYVFSTMNGLIRENREEDIKAARQAIRKQAMDMTWPEEQKKAIAELASEAIIANAGIDYEETSRLRQQRKDAVRPVLKTYKKGQVIVEKGTIITPENIRTLEASGIQRSRFNSSGFGGIAILNLIMITLVIFYIRQSQPDVCESPRMMLLLALVTVAGVGLCTLLIQSNPYFAPVPTAAIIIALLINQRVALMIVAFMAIIVGVLTGEVQYAATAFIIGSTSILAVRNVTRRLDLVTASIVVFLVNVLSVGTFSLILGRVSRVTVENLVFGGTNGFFSGIIAIGLLPLLEHGFGITTEIRLLELSNQSEPLLKRLLMEAPGTYHHSIIVGNLAEAGAQAVGEDPILCRVASYYHDIGKLKRPYFFIENQLGEENPHDKLSPNLSALIIMSHVKDGVELGKKNNLPEPVLDIIREHHGANLISYFYHQASKGGEAETSEQDFRYPGPRPRTKAAAIIMLADSVEAAARTLKTHSPQSIEELVRSIFKKYINDDQLSDSPLSLKNVQDLIATFTTILTGIYHHRIEYPDQIMKQAKANGIFSSNKVTPITRAR